MEGGCGTAATAGGGRASDARPAAVTGHSGGGAHEGQGWVTQRPDGLATAAAAQRTKMATSDSEHRQQESERMRGAVAGRGRAGRRRERKEKKIVFCVREKCSSRPVPVGPARLKHGVKSITSFRRHGRGKRKKRGERRKAKGEPKREARGGRGGGLQWPLPLPLQLERVGLTGRVGGG